MMNTLLIIANPFAGKGKPIKSLVLIEKQLNLMGLKYQIYLTQQTADIEGIQYAILRVENASAIIVVGGDGTLNDVVNALSETNKTPLIVLPCGSGNDFASFLYGKKSIEDILNGLIIFKTVIVDIGECNGKRFINNLGIGFDGWVAKKANEGPAWIPATLKYNFAILRGLLTFRSFYTNLGQALIIAIANGPSYGGGFLISPGANISDNLLDLWHIKPIEIIQRPYFLSLIKKGKHANSNGPYQHQTLKEINIQCHKEIPAHIDGEPFEAISFSVKLLEMKISFIV